MKNAVSSPTILGWLIEEMAKATEPTRGQQQLSMVSTEPGDIVVGFVPTELRPLLWLRFPLVEKIERLVRDHRRKSLSLIEQFQDLETADPETVGKAVAQSMIEGRADQRAIKPLQEKLKLIDMLFWHETRRRLDVLDKDGFLVAEGYKVVRRKQERRSGLTLDGLDIDALFGSGGH